MSSSDRRSFLLIALSGALAASLLLSGCGFSPAYEKGGLVEGLFGRVRASDPVTKNGFAFVQRIEERLGRPENRHYDLTYDIETKSIGVGITSDNRTTRYNLEGSIRYRLADPQNNEIASGKVTSFTAYAATGSTVAMLAAEEDAAERLMRILADQVVAQVMARIARDTARGEAASARASGG